MFKSVMMASVLSVSPITKPVKAVNLRSQAQTQAQAGWWLRNHSLAFGGYDYDPWVLDEYDFFDWDSPNGGYWYDEWDYGSYKKSGSKKS